MSDSRVCRVWTVNYVSLWNGNHLTRHFHESEYEAAVDFARREQLSYIVQTYLPYDGQGCDARTLAEVASEEPYFST